MHILNIDGSYFAQRILHAEHFTFKQPETLKREKIQFLRKLVTSLCHETKTIGNLDHVIFCLDRRSWRKDFDQVYPLTTNKDVDKQSYKKNRDDVEKSYDWEVYSEVYQQFVEVLRKFNVQILSSAGAEADDSCAISSQKLASVPGVHVTAWSSDGDYVTFINDNISLIKLPQKKIFRPLVATEVTMMSVFGKKINPVVQQLIASYNGLVEYRNPKYVALTKFICGDGKDNVPCIWKWLASTGKMNFSVTPKHLLKAIEENNLTIANITDNHLYDLELIQKLITSLIFITKQHTRFEGYDKKIHKIDVIKAELELEFGLEVSDFTKQIINFIKHSMDVYVSNRKMKYLDVKEIPEYVVNNILEDLKSAKGVANIKVLSDTNVALQMINLQETTSYFDKFNLDN